MTVRWVKNISGSLFITVHTDKRTKLTLITHWFCVYCHQLTLITHWLCVYCHQLTLITHWLCVYCHWLTLITSMKNVTMWMNQMCSYLTWKEMHGKGSGVGRDGCLIHPTVMISSQSASRDNWCTVGGDGGCRVGEVRAGTTSPMPDHKGFKLQ